ncbi:MAG: DNA primase [Phascolarctobacterium sp.]|nr:DNA primase [Phascolarctobacterium sp.]
MSEEFESFKERVRDSTDIVEVISNYVVLKKRGRNFWGCCPFHGEKTPSFAVNPEKNMFYCFGCHVGGDVFNFIMKSENCSFIEAIKILAEKYGIPVPEKQKTADEIEREKKTIQVMEANTVAAKFFQACLLNTRYGRKALGYLESRGITDGIISKFSIGFALNKFDALLVSLGKRGFGQELLVRVGLAAIGRNGVAYDKFRSRIMIPIRDLRGRIVGFGGRIVGDGQPKYMNTSETEWFNKRFLLFGLDIAAQEIRKKRQVLVVEGYMDAISLHAAGIGNTVASMGTAFAAGQAKILRKLADEVIFCYDSDEAGRRASVRAVSVAREAGLRVKVAGVPEGKDPDEFVRRYGMEAFMQVLQQALEGMEFQINETILQNNVVNFAGKAEAVSNILPFLLECKNEIEVSAYIGKVAQRLTIDEGLILDEYHKTLRSSGSRNGRSNTLPVVNVTATAVEQAEKLLLKIFLEYPELAVDNQDEISETNFTLEVYSIIYKAVLAKPLNEPVNVSRLSEYMSNDVLVALAEITVNQEGDCPKKDVSKEEASVIVADCLKQMKKASLTREYEKHSSLAVQYEQMGDKRFLEELMESQRIKNEIKKLYGN